MDKKKKIKPGKKIIASKADCFRKKLLKIIKQGIKEIIMDFSGVKTVDSMGLGVIIAVNNTFEKAGGKLLLTNVPEEFYTLCKAMCLDVYFEAKDH